jgi:hypothetical protein
VLNLACCGPYLLESCIRVDRLHSRAVARCNFGLQNYPPAVQFERFRAEQGDSE